MLKLAYFGLVAAFAVTLVTVSLDKGILSADNKENLTAGFKLVAEVPITDRKLTTDDSQLTTTSKPIERLPAPSAVAVSRPAPIPIPQSAPVLKPATPNPVVITASPSVVESTPVVASEPASIPTPTPTPEPTPAPEPLPSPASPPEPTPTPEPEPIPPPPAPEPTPEPEPVIAGPFISEILFDAVGSDSGKEFIKIYNPSNADLNLENWALKNGDTSLVKIGSKPEDVLVIKASSYLVVGLSGNIAADITRSATLPNGVATIVFINDSGVVIDSVSYDGANFEEGESWKKS